MKHTLIKRYRKDNGKYLEVGAEVDVDLIKERELRSKGYIAKTESVAASAKEDVKPKTKTKK